jgi:uncharacterized lipoprotein YddW (UPF0748 family)
LQNVGGLRCHHRAVVGGCCADESEHVQGGSWFLRHDLEPNSCGIAQQEYTTTNLEETHDAREHVVTHEHIRAVRAGSQKDVLQELHEICRETIPHVIWVVVFAFAVCGNNCAYAVYLLTASNQYGYTVHWIGVKDIQQDARCPRQMARRFGGRR